jgi:hypothetical protein
MIFVAFSSGVFILPSGERRSSVKVLEHWRQRKRCNPLRCFPNFLHLIWQLWHVMGFIPLVFLREKPYTQLSGSGAGFVRA